MNQGLRIAIRRLFQSWRHILEYTKESIHELVEKQRRFFKTGTTLSLDYRIARLKKLRDALKANEEELKEALGKDLGRHPAEAYFCDIGTTLIEINEAISGLKKWAKPELHLSGIMCFPSIFTRVYKMPYGVSLIISPFNFPILLSLGVLTAALAGGNTAIIKCSSKTENCTRVMQKMIQETFPEEYVTVIGGGHDVADMCLSERVDKIFYTGSPNVAKHVLEMAAKNLTPVALELGGETGNWCIVRKDADIKDAADKIAFFKLLNSGQICININQVAVAKEISEEFVSELKKAFERKIGNAVDNPEYPHLVSRGAYDKCAAEAEEYKDRIVYGGFGDPESLKYSPTVIYPVNNDEPIVMHELFSPLLPIVTFEDARADSFMDLVASREHGLSMYLFTKNKKWAEHVMSTQQYGGGCVNEVCLHLMVKGVPFNGTGHSGMGAYHGKWGFMEFTHPSTVLYGSSSFKLPLREHPYKEKYMKLIKFFEK